MFYSRLFLACMFFICIECSSAVKVSGESNPTNSPQDPLPVNVDAPVDTDTVDSLGKDVQALERQLIQYSDHLTPKQEAEVEALKEKIQKKETKKANLELQRMLGDWKEE